MKTRTVKKRSESDSQIRDDRVSKKMSGCFGDIDNGHGILYGNDRFLSAEGPGVCCYVQP